MLATTLSEKFTHPLELSRCPYMLFTFIFLSGGYKRVKSKRGLYGNYN
ncbi:protein of unknown function [Xenorhabdus nematophila AN6/1]|nr:hypothetical protein XNW1_1870013 [Xenorhabdus nematophila str. Websteri]CEF34281.1 hypothetical protein XNW1_920013 [Xenorhabdus nematophila str. Websteri]CEK23488.1 protein of unknown function [Xenorhabdus nematophila AN6/1]